MAVSLYIGFWTYSQTFRKNRFHIRPIQFGPTWFETVCLEPQISCRASRESLPFQKTRFKNRCIHWSNHGTAQHPSEQCQKWSTRSRKNGWWGKVSFKQSHRKNNQGKKSRRTWSVHGQGKGSCKEIFCLQWLNSKYSELHLWIRGHFLYYIRVFRAFFEPPTHLHKDISLHKVRETCHFLDHPPTPMSLRNIKMAPNVDNLVRYDL